MLKNAVFLALVGMVSVAFAQQGTTMGVVGVTRVSRPATGLSLIGNNFGDASSTLNEIAPIDQFGGSFLIGNADKIYMWNSAVTNYEVYALYESGETKEWRSGSDFYGSGVNPVVPVGSAFWLESAGAGSGTNLYISGNVVAGEVVTNQVVSGLQLLAYPFSCDIDLNDSSLKNGATGSFLIGNADKIYAWDISVTNYAVYALYQSGETKEWRDSDSFYSSAGAISVDLGHGFWYEAQNGFSWIETNAYFNNL